MVKGVLVIQRLLKIHPLMLAFKVAFLPKFEEKYLSFSFFKLKFLMNFITSSGFLKWAFKHSKASIPQREMNSKSLLLLVTS